jgi:plasmid stabilization system protein ParE
MKIVVSRAAQEDLLAGFRFYEQQTEGIGEYFLNALFSDIDSLILYAGIHSQMQGYYRMLAKRFPFAIYYKIERRTVRVRRILDCRRNPVWIRNTLK